MDATTVVQRLRTFLLVLAGGMCAGTIVELFLAEHTEDTIQWLPFVLCGLGLVVVAAALLRPRRGTLIGLRAVMALLFAGSLFGIYEHLEHNIAFAQEIRPGTSVGDVFFEALKGGNPLLAPGILALAAMIAVAATYYHPALARQATATVAKRSLR